MAVKHARNVDECDSFGCYSLVLRIVLDFEHLIRFHHISGVVFFFGPPHSVVILTC